MRGFTIIEMMVTVTVVAILVAIAVPSFTGIIVRNRLRSAAEQLRSDINFARSEAQKRNNTVVISFSRTATTWCYGTALSACDCTVTDTSAANFCFLEVDGSSNKILRVVSSTQYPGITLDSLPYGGSLNFSPVRLAATAGSASFTSSAGQKVQVEAPGLGRIRMCSPSGSATYLHYYDPC